ncbi:hypothetical protein [Acidihalobacter prosperus]|uniref:Uncharacterized protein n=1 Tax=Acidihalobacter prosperus TaxID=160660 RepID=A0A1A6C8P9_9GAMM|nr:hypothetical protein [Acidihalobacter prosperus]OBS10943.1 hypothetical protein Thpro_020659 [Acidihalobacter prosperus]
MSILRLGVALWLALVAAGLLLAGLLLLAWGFERWLSAHLGPVASLLLTGGTLLLSAGGIGWLASRRIR